MNARRVLIVVHRYTGLAAALFLAVVGLTGSILAFEPDYDRWLHSSVWRVSGSGPVAGEEALLDGVIRRFADSAVHVEQIDLAGAGLSQVFSLGNGLRVFVDPHSGTVLGTRRERTRLEQVLMYVRVVHVGLVAGEWGRRIVDVVSAAVVLLLIPIGLCLWWNKKRATLKWASSWKRINWDLHSVTGIYAGALVFVLATSGVFLGYEAPLYLLTRAAPAPVAPVPRSTIPDAAQPSASQSRPSLDSLLSAADRALPGAPTRRVVLAFGPRSPVQVVKEGAHGVGRSTVFLDQYSGAVLRVDDFSRASRAYRAHVIDQAVHMGTAFSLPVHIAFSLAGVALVLMVATGTLIWWRRGE